MVAGADPAGPQSQDRLPMVTTPICTGRLEEDDRGRGGDEEDRPAGLVRGLPRCQLTAACPSRPRGWTGGALTMPLMVARGGGVMQAPPLTASGRRSNYGPEAGRAGLRAGRDHRDAQAAIESRAQADRHAGGHGAEVGVLVLRDAGRVITPDCILGPDPAIQVLRHSSFWIGQGQADQP